MTFNVTKMQFAPLIISFLILFGTNLCHSESNNPKTASPEKPFRITAVQTQKSQKGTYVEITFNSNISSDLPLELYLFNSVKRKLIRKKRTSSRKEKVIFGPFQKLWNSSYEIECLLNEGHPIKQPSSPDISNLKYSYKFQLEDDTPPPFYQELVFRKSYREIVHRIYKLYINTYPSLIRFLHRPSHSRNSNSRKIRNFHERVQTELNTLTKQTRKINHSEATGFPFDREMKRIHFLLFYARVFYRKIFSDLLPEETQKRQNNILDISESAPPQLKRKFLNLSRKKLRKAYFLPKLHALLAQSVPSVRSVYFRASRTLINAYHDGFSLLLACMNRDQDTKLKTVINQREDKQRASLKKQQAQINNPINQHLWLYRDRVNALSGKEKRFRKLSLSLKRKSTALADMHKTILRRCQTSTKKDKTTELRQDLQKLLNRYAKIQKRFLQELTPRLTAIKEQFHRGYEVLKEQFKATSPDRNTLKYLVRFFQHWQNQWDKINLLPKTIQNGKCPLLNVLKRKRFSQTKSKKPPLNKHVRPREQIFHSQLRSLVQKLNQLSRILFEVLELMQKQKLSGQDNKKKTLTQKTNEMLEFIQKIESQ